MNDTAQSEAQILDEAIRLANQPSGNIRSKEVCAAGRVVVAAYESKALGDVVEMLYVIRELLAMVKEHRS